MYTYNNAEVTVDTKICELNTNNDTIIYSLLPLKGIASLSKLKNNLNRHKHNLLLILKNNLLYMLITYTSDIEDISTMYIINNLEKERIIIILNAIFSINKYNH